MKATSDLAVVHKAIGERTWAEIMGTREDKLDPSAVEAARVALGTTGR